MKLSLSEGCMIKQFHDRAESEWYVRSFLISRGIDFFSELSDN